jgi:hypothetical protein
MNRTVQHGSYLYTQGCRCDICAAAKREENRRYRLAHADYRGSHDAKVEADRRYKETHREYWAWQNAKARCFNPKMKSYKNYGERGITMAPEWVNDFPAFLAHIGPRPGLGYTLDRIDNERGYEPGNVRWATHSEQNRNKRPWTGRERQRDRFGRFLPGEERE